MKLRSSSGCIAVCALPALAWCSLVWFTNVVSVLVFPLLVLCLSSSVLVAKDRGVLKVRVVFLLFGVLVTVWDGFIFSAIKMQFFSKQLLQSSCYVF